MSIQNEDPNKGAGSNINEKIFEFPLLVDSSLKGGIVTYNQDLKNTKDKISECALELCDENGNKQKTNFFIDYETLFNINYEMKSFINQVNETIKNFNK